MKFLDLLFRREPWVWAGRSEYRVVAALIVFGFILRVSTLGHDSLWVDEGYTLSISQMPLFSMWTIPFDTHPPLYPTLIKPFLAFGVSEVSFRLFSVICGTLTLVPVYLLIKQLISNVGGLVSVVLLDLSFTLLVYSGNARNYALLFLLFCTVMMALYRLYTDLIKSNQSVSRSHIPWFSLYYGAALAALYTHNIAVIYILFANLVVYACAVTAAPQRFLLAATKLTLLNLPVVLGWVPWLLVIASTSGGFSWLPQVNAIEAIKTVAVVALPNRSTGLGGVIGVIAIAIGILACFRRNSDALLIGLAHLAALPALIWVFGFVYKPIFMERTILPVIVGSALLTAAAIAYLKPKRLTFGLISLVVAANVISTGAYLTRDISESNLGEFNLQNWRDAVYDSLVPGVETGFVVCTAFSHPTVGFYAHGSEVQLVGPDGNLISVTGEQWRHVYTRPVIERANGFFAVLDNHISADKLEHNDWHTLRSKFDRITFLGANIYCNESKATLVAERLIENGWTLVESKTYSGVIVRSFVGQKTMPPTSD